MENRLKHLLTLTVGTILVMMALSNCDSNPNTPTASNTVGNVRTDPKDDLKQFFADPSYSAVQIPMEDYYFELQFLRGDSVLWTKEGYDLQFEQITIHKNDTVVHADYIVHADTLLFFGTYEEGGRLHLRCLNLLSGKVVLTRETKYNMPVMDLDQMRVLCFERDEDAIEQSIVFVESVDLVSLKSKEAKLIDFSDHPVSSHTISQDASMLDSVYDFLDL